MHIIQIKNLNKAFSPKILRLWALHLQKVGTAHMFALCQPAPSFRNHFIRSIFLYNQCTGKCHSLSSLFSGGNNLLLEDGGLGEAKSYLVCSQSMIAVSDGGDLILHEVPVQWVEVDLLVLLSVKAD